MLKGGGHAKIIVLCFPSSVEACEFVSEFLPVVFMVKNAVENGPWPLPHFIFRLRSNVGGD